MPEKQSCSYSLGEWCQRRRISRGMYYKMKAGGRGPKIYYVGTHVRISDEADAEWLR
jgi:hypothetical protein